MATAINQAYDGRLRENYYLVKVFPQRFWGRGRAVHAWWGQQARLKEGGHFW